MIGPKRDSVYLVPWRSVLKWFLCTPPLATYKRRLLSWNLISFGWDHKNKGHGRYGRIRSLPAEKPKALSLILRHEPHWEILLFTFILTLRVRLRYVKIIVALLPAGFTKVKILYGTLDQALLGIEVCWALGKACHCVTKHTSFTFVSPTKAVS